MLVLQGTGQGPARGYMNGERAETILRLLAEAELRNQLAPDPPPGRVDPARAERLSAPWRLATGHGELDLGVAAGASAA